MSLLDTYRSRRAQLHVDLLDRLRPALVRNAGRPPIPGLPWSKTAEQVEPGARTDRGRFRFYQARESALSRATPLYGRYSADAGTQQALAAADERAHGEAHSLIPRLKVSRIYGTVVGDRPPHVQGTTRVIAPHIHESLTAAGYVPGQQSGGPVYVHTHYVHPDGHSVGVTSPRQGWGTSYIGYTPRYKPDHPDENSRAADAASLDAHVKTGAAFDSKTPWTPQSEKIAAAAKAHGHAAFLHHIMRDEAIKNGDDATLAHHDAMQKYHEAVTRRLSA